MLKIELSTCHLVEVENGHAMVAELRGGLIAALEKTDVRCV